MGVVGVLKVLPHRQNNLLRTTISDRINKKNGNTGIYVFPYYFQLIHLFIQEASGTLQTDASKHGRNLLMDSYRVRENYLVHNN